MSCTYLKIEENGRKRNGRGAHPNSYKLLNIEVLNEDKQQNARLASTGT